MNRETKLKLALSVSATTLALPLGGLAIRVVRPDLFNYGQDLLTPRRHLPMDGFYTKDSLLGWYPTPGAHYTDPKGGWIVNVNNQGLRVGPSKSNTLVVGDSYTFGWGVSDSETWPARAGLLNGGVPSYGVDQMVLRAEQLIGILHPKRVLIALIPDDLHRLPPVSVQDLKAITPGIRANIGVRAGLLEDASIRLSKLGVKVGFVLYRRGQDATCDELLLGSRKQHTLNLCSDPLLIDPARALPREIDRYQHPDAEWHRLVAEKVAKWINK